MSKRPPPINPSDPAQIRKANEDLALLIRRLQSCLDDALSEGLAPRGMADILDHANTYSDLLLQIPIELVRVDFDALRRAQQSLVRNDFQPTTDQAFALEEVAARLRRRMEYLRPQLRSPSPTHAVRVVSHANPPGADSTRLPLPPAADPDSPTHPSRALSPASRSIAGPLTRSRGSQDNEEVPGPLPLASSSKTVATSALPMGKKLPPANQPKKATLARFDSEIHKLQVPCDRCSHGQYICFVSKKGRSKKCVRCAHDKKACVLSVSTKTKGKGKKDEGGDDDDEEHVPDPPSTPPVATGSKRLQPKSPENTSGRRPSKRSNPELRALASTAGPSTRPLPRPRGNAGPTAPSMQPNDRVVGLSLDSGVSAHLADPHYRSPTAPSHSTDPRSRASSTLSSIIPPPATESESTGSSSRRSDLSHAARVPVYPGSSSSSQMVFRNSVDQRSNMEHLRTFNVSSENLTANIHEYEVAQTAFRRHEASHRREVEADLITMLDNARALASASNLSASFTQRQISQFQQTVGEFFRNCPEYLSSDPRIGELQGLVANILSRIFESPE
ncbi:hypothetical protein HYPSUDRAFT_542901 [Hypholoma sublateritium FD-334 SS-4]|uniref:Uncharacterized protein n=1 Tax=Hypholoma sublateritium (strain FD-334 SS-4) TaxID=945553 RepID=A0A0D2NYT0_HYPSF|nr:hypothetical protein HYPSUDRAFT_542901 [Hypholoma sublateritium FD-334 SS-4]